MNSHVLTSEELYDLHWWFVLEKIKKELLKNDTSVTRVIYSLFLHPTINDPATPNSAEEQLIISKLEKDGLIKKTEETTDFAVGGTNPTAVGVTHYLEVDIKKFDDYYNRYKKTQNKYDRYCYFDDNIFFLTLRDNSVKAISFDTVRGTRKGLALFQAIIGHWKIYGEKPITRVEIINAMARYGSRVESFQLRSIISNVRKKIIAAGLENCIQINFEEKSNGWKVTIQR